MGELRSLVGRWFVCKGHYSVRAVDSRSQLNHLRGYIIRTDYRVILYYIQSNKKKIIFYF